MSVSTQLTVDNNVRMKAWGWTIGIHAILLLLLFLIKYTVPTVMPAEELGMEVNLGTDENGSGDDQPMDMEDPAATASIHNSNRAPSASSSEKELMESNDKDAPVIKRTTATTHNARQHNTNSTTATNTNNATTVNTQQTTQQVQKPRYVYDGANGRGGNSATSNHAGTSEGNTTGNGDRGVPGGTPGAANYEGSPGNGTGGISHTLSGREISPKRFSAEFNEGGKVVIRIKVDRNGAIISKSIKSSPSAALSRIALQKLSEAKFNASPNAAPEQFGEITIVFKTRS